MYIFSFAERDKKSAIKGLMKMQQKFYVGCKTQIMQQFTNIKKIHMPLSDRLYHKLHYSRELKNVLWFQSCRA